MARCGQEQPHGKSFEGGRWVLGGWIPGTHQCLCKADAVISLTIELGQAGLFSKVNLDLCLNCARELSTGIRCEIDGALEGMRSALKGAP